VPVAQDGRDALSPLVVVAGLGDRADAAPAGRAQEGLNADAFAAARDRCLEEVQRRGPGDQIADVRQ
jgi:hypothetical protein